MIPPRKSIPPPRPAAPDSGFVKIQPNRGFDDEAEMNQWLKSSMPEAKVVKFWSKVQIYCEVLMPEKKQTQTKGKKK